MIAIRWLKTVFIPYTQPKDDQWRILIMDGHKSHTSVEFMDVRGVGSFIATGDPLLTSISNLRKERKEI
jgi:hypothetical protein